MEITLGICLLIDHICYSKQVPSEQIHLPLGATTKLVSLISFVSV